jgi:hypothetical protein
MARILAYTTPGRGHLYPLIPILGELRRGHQVVLRTLAAEAASMRQRGFDAGPISDRIEATPMTTGAPPAHGRRWPRQGARGDPAARGRQTHPARVRHRRRAISRRRRVRDPPAAPGTTTEATVPTGPGIFSRLRRLGRRWR